MEKEIRPTKAEKILLALTLVFFAVLLVAYQLRAGGPQAGVTVETEIADPAAGLVPQARRININEDGEETLARLPGVGPAIAARIVAYREAHGGFSSLEELTNVSGIGEKKLEELRPYAAA